MAQPTGTPPIAHLHSILGEKLGPNQHIAGCTFAKGSMFLAASGGPEGFLAAYNPETADRTWQQTFGHSGKLVTYGPLVLAVGQGECLVFNTTNGACQALPLQLPKEIARAQQGPGKGGFRQKKALIPFLYTAQVHSSKLYLVYQMARQTDIALHPVTGQAEIQNARIVACVYDLPKLNLVASHTLTAPAQNGNGASLSAFTVAGPYLFYALRGSGRVLRLHMPSGEMAATRLPAVCTGLCATGGTLYSLHEERVRTLSVFEPESFAAQRAFVLNQQLSHWAGPLGAPAQLLKELEWCFGIPAAMVADEAAPLLAITLGTCGALVWDTQRQIPVSVLRGNAITGNQIKIAYPYVALYSPEKLDIWKILL